jgi:hypothetical protein
MYFGGEDCIQILMCIFLNREYNEYFQSTPLSTPISSNIMYDVVSAQVQNTLTYADISSNDVFTVSKTNGVYISRVYRPTQLPELGEYSISPVRSNIRFLGIYYVHPEMKRPILLRIPKTMMNVGNHILCATHVVQILRQLPIYTRYVFDTRYNISILDHNARRITLHYAEYVVLGENDYQIVKNE